MRADVPFIRTRMHGVALRPGVERQRGGSRHARDAERARVAQQGHLVEIDWQRGHAPMGIETGGEQRVHGAEVTARDFARPASTGEYAAWANRDDSEAAPAA